MKVFDLIASVFGKCASGRYFYASGLALRHMEYPFFPEMYKPLYRKNHRFVNSNEEEGICIDPGEVWPDFLAVGSQIPPFLVSEKVIQFFQDHQIKLHSITEFKIVAASSDCKIFSPPPRYFAITAFPGIMRVAEKRKISFLSSTYKGLDVFSSYFEDQEATSMAGIFVTDEIKSAMMQANLTNVEFREVFAE